MPRFFSSALSNTLRRCGAVLVSCLAAATLVSCGGGTQSKKFVPESFVVFGDEFALVKSNGSRYGVNEYYSSSTTTEYKCYARFNWIMVFAYDLGFKFGDQCANDWPFASSKPAVMLANDPGIVGAGTVSEVAATAATAVANAGANAVLTTINNNLGILNDKTLVTVSVGRADIVQAYLAYLNSPDSATLSSLKSSLKTLGNNFSAGLKPVVQRGARVMLVAGPGLGESPLAKADAANLSRNKAAMAELSTAFNEGIELGASIAGITGQQLSFVRLDQITNVMVAAFNTFGSGTGNGYNLDNIDAPACASYAAAPVAPICLNTTLTATGADQTYLWSDATHINNTGTVQTQYSSYVYSAFQRNPF